MDLTAPLLQYCEQAATPGWRPFHQALAAELAAGLPEAEVRRLFQRIGQRVAEALPVPRCEDTAQLQQAFNAHWSALGWGVVVLEEQSSRLRLVHACSPLVRQFGPQGLAWADCFFEGVYGRWFESQGLPAELSVRALPAQQPRAWIELSLGRGLP